MLGILDRSLLGIAWLNIQGKSDKKGYIQNVDVLLVKYTL